jgi:hypothetical protein
MAVDRFDRLAELADESDIETKGTEFAERRGWFAVKLMRCNKDSMPDRLYHRKGMTLYVEYKKPGEVPTTKQAKRHRELRAQGIPVHAIDNLEDAYVIFR